MFGQLSNRESLPGLIVALDAHHFKCYHLGMGKNVSKSSLARANQDRDYRIVEEYAYFSVNEVRERRKTGNIRSTPSCLHQICVYTPAYQMPCSRQASPTFRTLKKVVKACVRMELNLRTCVMKFSHSISTTCIRVRLWFHTYKIYVRTYGDLLPHVRRFMPARTADQTPKNQELTRY